MEYGNADGVRRACGTACAEQRSEQVRKWLRGTREMRMREDRKALAACLGGGETQRGRSDVAATGGATRWVVDSRGRAGLVGPKESRTRLRDGVEPHAS